MGVSFTEDTMFLETVFEEVLCFKGGWCASRVGYASLEWVDPVLTKYVSQHINRRYLKPCSAKPCWRMGDCMVSSPLYITAIWHLVNKNNTRKWFTGKYFMNAFFFSNLYLFMCQFYYML